MARVSLARQQLTDTGLTAAYSPAAAEGHAVENNGRVILHVCNDSESEVTITILTGYIRAGLKLADRVINVGPGKSVFIGPFPPEVYNQSDTGAGQVHIDYSSVEKVTVAALLFP